MINIETVKLSRQVASQGLVLVTEESNVFCSVHFFPSI